MHSLTQAPDDSLPAQAGQRLARGVCRLLDSLGHAALTEFSPTRGLRVDVISVGPKGEVWVVECKSCRADFMADRKWQGYLDWCDRFFWACDSGFPQDLLPKDAGLILADPYGADLLRMSPEARLAGARRTSLTRQIARTAARRVQALTDPQGVSGGAF